MKQNIEEFVIADPQDWKLLEMISEVDQEGFGVDGISPFNLSMFARAGYVMALISDGKVAAEAVLLRGHEPDTGFVFGFASSVAFRGQGKGTILMQHMIDFAHSVGMVRLELTVNPENPLAIKLYQEKYGFVKIEDLKSHPEKHEPRILMQKKL